MLKIGLQFQVAHDVTAIHVLGKGCVGEMSKSNNHRQNRHFAEFHVVCPIYHLCV